MKAQHILLTAAAVLSFSLSALYSAERFDQMVRADFFAGYSGNVEALERGMTRTAEVLKENPNHAEALVWHGGGLFYLSGQAFQKQDFAKGQELMQRGIGEMSKAVALEPKNIGVRVPRAAALSAGARVMPPQMAKPLFAMILDDYYTVYEMQKDSLDRLGSHPLGELLFGLADINSRAGNVEKADYFFRALAEKLPDTAYAKRAGKWFETKQPLPVAQTQCLGCHTEK